MDQYVGQIIMFAGDFIPEGWLPCDGRLLNSDEHSDLFNVIGLTYGGSDDQFALPDLRGRLPLGSGTQPYPTGRQGGTTTVTLRADQIPAHKHTTNDSENKYKVEFTAKEISPLLPSVVTGTGNGGLPDAPVDKLLARAALTTGGSTKTALQAMPANTPIAGSAYLGGVTGGFTLNSKVRGPVTLKPVGGASQKGASQDSVLPVSILPPSLGIHFLIATTGRMEW